MGQSTIEENARQLLAGYRGEQRPLLADEMPTAVDTADQIAGTLERALSTRTDFGAPGYGGPCPPPGDHPHRYLFTLFAVKTERLEVRADTSAAVVGFNLHFNTLAKAAIMGLYKR